MWKSKLSSLDSIFNNKIQNLTCCALTSLTESSTTYWKHPHAHFDLDSKSWVVSFFLSLVKAMVLKAFSVPHSLLLTNKLIDFFLN